MHNIGFGQNNMRYGAYTGELHLQCRNNNKNKYSTSFMDNDFQQNKTKYQYEKQNIRNMDMGYNINNFQGQNDNYIKTLFTPDQSAQSKGTQQLQLSWLQDESKKEPTFKPKIIMVARNRLGGGQKDKQEKGMLQQLQKRNEKEHIKELLRIYTKGLQSLTFRNFRLQFLTNMMLVFKQYKKVAKSDMKKALSDQTKQGRVLRKEQGTKYDRFF